MRIRSHDEWCRSEHRKTAKQKGNARRRRGLARRLSPISPESEKERMRKRPTTRRLFVWVRLKSSAPVYPSRQNRSPCTGHLPPRVMSNHFVIFLSVAVDLVRYLETLPEQARRVAVPAAHRMWRLKRTFGIRATLSRQHCLTENTVSPALAGSSSSAGGDRTQTPQNHRRNVESAKRAQETCCAKYCSRRCVTPVRCRSRMRNSSRYAEGRSGLAQCFQRRSELWARGAWAYANMPRRSCLSSRPSRCAMRSYLLRRHSRNRLACVTSSSACLPAAAASISARNPAF